VQFSPFLHMREGSWRKHSARYSGFHFYGNLRAAVNCMEVRRIMIIVVHCDHDSQESTDFRHAMNLRLREQCCNVMSRGSTRQFGDGGSWVVSGRFDPDDGEALAPGGLIAGTECPEVLDDERLLYCGNYRFHD